MSAPSYLPNGCSDETNLTKGKAIDLYKYTMDDPMGGDLPGGRSGVVGFIILNRKDKSVNVIDDVLSDELSEATSKMRQENVDTVVVISSKESGFCVGADLHKVYPATSYDEMEKSLRKAVAAFDTLARFPVPTIAIIHGVCLGGGYELALACTIRMAAKKSSIGLPEVKVGIIPGAGGVIRLPRLIGLTNALKYILRGRVVNTDTAYEERLVDYIVEARTGNSAMKEVDSLIWDVIIRSPVIQLQRGPSNRDTWIEGTLIGKLALGHMSSVSIDAAVKHRYPAPYVALDVMQRCLFKLDSHAAAEYMIKATASLCITNQAKTFMGLWLGNKGVAKYLKSVPKPVFSTETQQLSHVLIGPPRDVAIGILGAIKRNVFCILCGLTPSQRLSVLGELEELADPRVLEAFFPRMQKSESFINETPPSSTGYGLVAVVWDEKDKEGIEENFLRFLPSRGTSNWMWIRCQDSVPIPPKPTYHCRADFHQCELATATEVAPSEMTPFFCHRMAEDFNFSVIPRSVPDSNSGLLDHCAGLIFKAICSSGLCVSALESQLRQKRNCLQHCITGSYQTRLGLDHTLLPESSANPAEKTCKFIVTLCTDLLLLQKKTDDWLTREILDYLFVSALGWESYLGGPFTIFDNLYVNVDIGSPI
eukprot:TRINITY_DN6598_c0_g1_i2.p1 TRINITY_DN6598_c0_g1~~TRINITY_DN6598_c0_g1_i2.p1  ORF type:complete len:650 (+),score=88.18 TRINITY_DN6598_c0_g1_i2:85-2034(+)